jgi:hypothetical protein
MRKELKLCNQMVGDIQENTQNKNGCRVEAKD